MTRLLRSRGGGGGIRLLIAAAVAEVGSEVEEEGGGAPAPGAVGGDIVGVFESERTAGFAPRIRSCR